MQRLLISEEKVQRIFVSGFFLQIHISQCQEIIMGLLGTCAVAFACSTDVLIANDCFFSEIVALLHLQSLYLW